MTDRYCVRGCTLRGVHYATCPAYTTGIGCDGCAQAEARDGVLLCHRCYGRLWRQFEIIPDLIAHLRSIADPMKAAVYDRVMVSGSAPEVAPAPVSSDLLDATIDIMHTLGARPLPAGADSERAYTEALGAVGTVLAQFESIAADKTAVMQWWDLVMVAEHPEHPDYWTVTKALRRWPLEDRRHWAKQPCPECGLRTVKITPPRHVAALTWFGCTKCDWHRSDMDDDGLWAAAFGMHADEETKETKVETQKVAAFAPDPIDMQAPLRAGMQYVIEHPVEVTAAGPVGVPAATLVAATPLLAEQFARMAEQLAAHVKGTYDNGALIAGGARMVAEVIRASVKSDIETEEADHDR